MKVNSRVEYYPLARERVMTSTCKVCLDDFDDESMIEDIEGSKYCLLDSGDICSVCGIYELCGNDEHKCEGDSNE